MPWAGLGLLAGAWVPLARLAATAPPDPEDGVTAFRMAALALGLGAAVALEPAGRAGRSDSPLRLVDLPGGPGWAASQAWTLALGLALAGAALLLEARAGTRLAMPGHRPIGARPATEGRAGP